MINVSKKLLDEWQTVCTQIRCRICSTWPGSALFSPACLSQYLDLKWYSLTKGKLHRSVDFLYLNWKLLLTSPIKVTILATFKRFTCWVKISADNKLNYFPFFFFFLFFFFFFSEYRLKFDILCKMSKETLKVLSKLVASKILFFF